MKQVVVTIATDRPVSVNIAPDGDELDELINALTSEEAKEVEIHEPN